MRGSTSLPPAWLDDFRAHFAQATPGHAFRQKQSYFTDVKRRARCAEIIIIAFSYLIIMTL